MLLLHYFYEWWKKVLHACIDCKCNSETRKSSDNDTNNNISNNNIDNNKANDN